MEDYPGRVAGCIGSGVVLGGLYASTGGTRQAPKVAPTLDVSLLLIMCLTQGIAQKIGGAMFGGAAGVVAAYFACQPKVSCILHLASANYAFQNELFLTADLYHICITFLCFDPFYMYLLITPPYPHGICQHQAPKPDTKLLEESQVCECCHMW